MAFGGSECVNRTPGVWSLRNAQIRGFSRSRESRELSFELLKEKVVEVIKKVCEVILEAKLGLKVATLFYRDCWRWGWQRRGVRNWWNWGFGHWWDSQ